MPMKVFSLMLLSALIAALSVICVLQILPQQHTQIASIDLAGVMLREMNALQREGLDEELIKQRTERFAIQLNAAIEQLSEEHQVVLIAGSAVVGGAPDYTELLIDRVYRSGGER